MITVYVLKSVKSDIFYTGMTKDLENRIMEHNSGKSKFTSGHVPWLVIYTEEHRDWNEARVREKYLKSTSGKRWLMKKLMEE
jgi:predicted GIY-YIG superfamily endonuclease